MYCRHHGGHNSAYRALPPGYVSLVPMRSGRRTLAAIGAAEGDKANPSIIERGRLVLTEACNCEQESVRKVADQEPPGKRQEDQENS